MQIAKIQLHKTDKKILKSMSLPTATTEELNVAAVSPSVPTNTSSLSECLCFLAKSPCNFFLKPLLLLAIKIVFIFFFT